jgi:hypothetical protein
LDAEEYVGQVELAGVGGAGHFGPRVARRVRDMGAVERYV